MGARHRATRESGVEVGVGAVCHRAGLLWFSLCSVIAQYLQLFEGLYHQPGGFAFSNQVFQRFVAGTNPLHTSRNELVLGGPISCAAQSPLCGLVFLGDLFPKSRDFAVSLYVTHELFPSPFLVSGFFCLAALPHIQK